ncbi:hypothetical protein EN847_34065, partial [Mesorhizobium sp. M1C.F.Ca.ET.204.01.1.1]
ANLIRIDIGADQIVRRPVTDGIQADCAEALRALLGELGTAHVAAKDGDARAAAVRKAALAELSPALTGQMHAVETIRDTLPGAIIVGDSTQPIYAANLYYDHDRPGGWFNAA